MAKTTAIYVRVSHRDQSHASQLPDLERWAESHDGPVEWFRDTFTGRTMDRPRMSRLQEELRAGRRAACLPVADLLIGCIPEDREWGDDGDITFQIPKHVAWEIRELAEEEGYSWACFAPALTRKLNDFCWGIV